MDQLWRKPNVRGSDVCNQMVTFAIVQEKLYRQVIVEYQTAKSTGKLKFYAVLLVLALHLTTDTDTSTILFATHIQRACTEQLPNDIC